MCYTEGQQTCSWGPCTVWQHHCKDFARGLRCHVLRNKRAEAKWVERKHSMLWIHYCGPRIDADTVNPRCCGRPLDPELYLSCVCNLFCRGFYCSLYFRVARNKHVSAYRGRGSFPTVTFSWSLPQQSNIAYKQALGGWGEGVREEKGRENSSFPAHFTPPQPAWRLRKTRIMKIRFPSYLGIVFILPSKCYVLKERLRGQRIKRERLGTRLGLVHFVVLHISGNAVLVQL